MSPVSPPSGARAQTFLDVLVRLTPVEIIAPYLCVATLLPERRVVALPLLAVGVLSTLGVLIWSARVQGQRVPPSQHAVRVLSFLAWAFATGNPLAPDPSVTQAIPAIAVLLIPLFGSAMLFPPSRPS